MPDSHHSRGLLVISVFKIAKGLALIALGFGALGLLHKDMAHEVSRWVDAFRVDPGNRVVRLLFEKISLLDDRRLKELSAGTFAYAALFLTEGVGLAFGKRWAEYLTIVATASFIPLEVYELVRRLTIPRATALIINLAIVAYLARDLRRGRRLREKN